MVPGGLCPAVVTSRVTSVGKYKVTRLIGQGGMGSVYIAIDTVLGRQVAMKVLHSHLCRAQEMLDRFRNEALTHAKLEHPNIVRLYDFIAADDLWLIAMEYVPGGRNLGDLIHGTPLPQKVACDVLRQTLRGVAYAHGEGVVHRDIKPANILIGEERGRIRPKLTDFGIAKALHTTSMTQPGSVLGTVDYMSPEQCLGKPVDQRSDLYSIGVVFYECITGRVPFRASTEYQVMQAHVDNPPERPDRYNPDLLPGLVAICLRALEKDPDKRYQTANAILDDLDALAQDLDRLPDVPLELPPPRVTAVAGDDVGEGDEQEAPIPDAPTAFAGIPSQPASQVVRVATRPLAGLADVVAASGRVSTPSMENPATTTATPEEAPPVARRKGRAGWVFLLLLLLGGAAAGAYYYLYYWRTADGDGGTAATNAPAAPGNAEALRQLMAAGRFVEALESVLAGLPPEGAEASVASAQALADLMEQAAAVLPPDRRAQAAQALERCLRKSAAGVPPSADVLAAVTRAATALAGSGDVSRATKIVAAAGAAGLDPKLAETTYAALAAAVPQAASFDDAFAVVRLLSEVPPDSPLYEPARRALGTAKEAILVRERAAAEDALRAGRWTDASASLQRLQQDLGDTSESTRQFQLKARDLQSSGGTGPCMPVGLARPRDPAAPSRNVGRPQLAWTGEDYLVVWSDARAAPEDSTAQQVFLQRLDASGKRLNAVDKAISRPGADAGRPTIDCLDKQCGMTWDESTGTERRVVFQALDFLGNPAAASTVVAAGVSPVAYPTVAVARSGSLVVYAVAWVGREVLDPERKVERDAAALAILDHEGKVIDGPRFLHAPRPEDEGTGNGPGGARTPRAVRPRPTITRLPHVVGLGDDGFVVAWEEEGDGQVLVVLAAFTAAGGEPRWVQKVIPEGAAARSIEGRIPFLTYQAEAKRIAVLWVDRYPAVDALEVSLFDRAGTPGATSVAARGTFRYHGGLFVGDDLVATRWSRGKNARLGLVLCPLATGCPPLPETDDPSAGIPLASLGGRVGLAPGAARGEFAAVWRERPGAAAPGEEGEADDSASVGDEIFFVRFRCDGL